MIRLAMLPSIAQLYHNSLLHCTSLASAVFMVGKTRTMAKGSRLMIHRPWVGGISGESNDLRKSADLLDSLEGDLVAAYSGPTGLPEDKIREMMEAETWLTVEEAQALGFATSVSAESRNSIPAEYLAKFENVPQDLLERTEPEAEATVPNTMAGLRSSVKQLTGELQARTKERDDARAALVRTKTLLSALERSYGLAAAGVVIPAPPESGEAPDVLETLAGLSGAEMTRFYKQHKQEIWSAQNRKQFNG
jgi:hypothetical protein